ncbi:neurofilament heavy polypeptide-like [Thunnus thynnus]|uniref:neurofilament heavy polypeptide-like n=1 Tax=Thunnus thynnus TaxID=8237 RepID=UPI0035299F34
MTPVPLKTELMETVVVEDRKESSLKKSHGERIFMAEADGHRQEKVRTERVVELWESSAREETTLKRGMRQQMVLAKEEEEVPTWDSEDQEVEDAESLEDSESAYTECEAEKLEDIKLLVQEEKVVHQTEESSSLTPVIPLLKEPSCLPSTRDITPPPEKTNLMKKKLSPLETGVSPEEEVLTYKKMLQERKHKEAGVSSTYTEQKDVFETQVPMCAEDIVPYEESSSPMKDFIKPKITATHQEVTVPKKPGVPKEVTLLKEADSVKEFTSQRSMSPPQETVSPPPERDLPKTPPKTAVSHSKTDILHKKEVIPPKKMESSREEIKKSPKAAGKVPLDIIEPLVKPTHVLEEMPPEEEFAAFEKEVSSPVQASVPLPEKTVCRPPKESVVPTKKETTLALSKADVPPKEDFAPADNFPPGEVTLPKKAITEEEVAPTKKSQITPRKKPVPPEEGTIPSSSAQKEVAPVEVDSFEEVRTDTTKRPPTRDDKKTKKGTQRIEQQTLLKGILLYLSHSGS